MTSEFFAARINAQEVIYNDVEFSGELKTKSFLLVFIALVGTQHSWNAKTRNVQQK